MYDCLFDVKWCVFMQVSSINFYTQPAAPNPAGLAPDRLIAHRGSGKGPGENTLSAMKTALDLQSIGVVQAEFDIRLTQVASFLSHSFFSQSNRIKRLLPLSSF